MRNFSHESNINKTSVWLIKEAQGHTEATGRLPVERHHWRKGHMIYFLYLSFHLFHKMSCIHIELQASSQGKAYQGAQHLFFPLGPLATCAAKSQVWFGKSTKKCHRPPPWHLRALGFGWFMNLWARLLGNNEARWVLYVLYFFFFPRDSFNSHFQTPDGDFVSSDEMLFSCLYFLRK